MKCFILHHFSLCISNERYKKTCIRPPRSQVRRFPSQSTISSRVWSQVVKGLMLNVWVSVFNLQIYSLEYGQGQCQGWVRVQVVFFVFGFQVKDMSCNINRLPFNVRVLVYFALGIVFRGLWLGLRQAQCQGSYWGQGQGQSLGVFRFQVLGFWFLV